MARRPQPAHIIWPFTERTAEDIEKCFRTLFQDMKLMDLVPVVSGGTGVTTFAAGDLLYAPSLDVVAGLPIAAVAGKFLRSTGLVPEWSDLILPNDAAQGDLLYANAADTIVVLPKSTVATRYLSNTGASNNPAWAQVDLTNGVTGILPPGSGGTGSSTLLTQGSVVFAGVGGVFSEDNANFFWDDANNRLGLGLATPGYKLDVRHTSSASQAHIGSDSADEGGYFTAFNAFDSFVVSRAAFNGSNWIAKAATAELVALDAGSVQFSVNTGLTPGVSFTPTERVRINATGLGVHTTPGHAFDVNIDPGTVGTVVFAGLGDLVGTNPLFYLQGSDGTAAMRSRNAHPLAFWTNNVEQARITTAGLMAFGGGGTSSYPALKRAAAILEVRLADDSAYAEIKASNVTISPATGTFNWLASSRIQAPTDGVITLFNAAENTFGRLQFGGTTASFPAIKRNGAAIEFRFADDSDWASISASGLTTTSSINIGGAINGSSHVRAGATGSIYWEARSSMKSFVDSVITLYNQAENNFSKLQFGGTTASFPALRRNSAVLDVVLADESAYGTFNAGAYNVGGTPGASFGPGAVTSITVVNGIVTAIS